MLTFNEWSRGNVIRFYAQPSKESAFIELSKNGCIRICCSDGDVISEIGDFLEGNGFSLQKAYTIDTLRSELERFKKTSPAKKRLSQPSTHQQFNSSTAISTSSASLNSLKHDPGTIKLKASTQKHVMATVDTRETAETLAHYQKGAISCSYAKLDIGDIQYLNEKEKTLLLIERKTINDFYQSIVSSRAHSQAERLFLHAKKLREDGWRVMVCWFIVQSGNKTIYDILPDTKQMDGMINYLTAILGQHVYSVLNEHHGAYLATKLAQGFNELQLTYPVKNETGQRVDIPKSSMDFSSARVAQDEGSDHNVRLAQSNQLLYVLTAFSSVNIKVAKSLANTGKSLLEILSMTESELKTIDGIGGVLAKKIAIEFSV